MDYIDNALVLARRESGCSITNRYQMNEDHNARRLKTTELITGIEKRFYAEREGRLKRAFVDVELLSGTRGMLGNVQYLRIQASM